MHRLPLWSGISSLACCGGALVMIWASVPRSVIALQASSTPAAAGRCSVAPRSVPEMIALLRPPTENGEEFLEPQPLPVGIPADAMTVAAIAATVQELEACVNAGDLPRFYSLLSDDWFRALPRRDDILADLTALETATPSPIPEGERAVFIGPWDVRVLDDGRVVAAVVWFASESDSCPEPDRTRALIFSEHDGRWTVDEVIDHTEHFQPVFTVLGPPPEPLLAARQMSCE